MNPEARHACSLIPSSVVLVGCGSDSPEETDLLEIVDASPCPAGQVLRYTSPGCGPDVKPGCGSANQDACARSACGCSGKVLFGCDFFSEPWSKMTDGITGCGGDGGATIDTGVSEAGRLD